MQKHLAIGRGVKTLNQKNRGGGGSVGDYRLRRFQGKDKQNSYYAVSILFLMPCLEFCIFHLD